MVPMLSDSVRMRRLVSAVVVDMRGSCAINAELKIIDLGQSAFSIRDSVGGGAFPLHGDTAGRVESSFRLVFQDGMQDRAEFVRRNLFEAELGVKRSVEWDVAKGCQRHCCKSRTSGPVADGCNEFRAEAAAAVLREDVDFLEMGETGFQQLYLRETDGAVAGECDPEVAAGMGGEELLRRGGFLQDGFGSVGGKQPGGGEFDGRQRREIL